MRRNFLIAALLILSGLVLLRIADPIVVSSVREGYFDLLQRLEPRAAGDLPVRVVDIDEASLAELGQWPWPRTRLADLVDRLTGMGAAVVAFDVLCAEPDRLSPARLLDNPAIADGGLEMALAARGIDLDNDQAFANAINRGFVVLGIADGGGTGTTSGPAKAGFVEVGPAPTAFLTPLATTTPVVPALRDAALGIGAINVSRNARDGIIREVPLVWAGPDGPVPSLALEALRVAMGETTLVLMGTEAAPGLETIRLAGYDMPTTDAGELRVRYRPDDPSLYLSAREVLDPASQDSIAPRVAGHIVFVGTSAAGLLDIRSTPLGEQVPGVSIHAQIVEQILTDDYLRRSDLIAGTEVLALVAIGLVVSLVMASTGAAWSVAAGGAAAVVLVAASWLAFSRAGILFDATFPLIGGFVAFSALAMFQFIVTDREKRLIRRSFSKYVSQDVLGEIEGRGHALELGGEIREVTVLFSDIRNFTPLSERLEAQELVALLNALFSDLTDEILAERGTIDKYIGDSIMAFWNAPLETPGHPLRACRAALAMRAARQRFNDDRVARGLDPIEISVGLATGSACVGNIGSRARYNYSVVGETVNKAARIEASCRHVEYDILVGAEVAAAAGDLALLEAGSLALKGVSARIPSFVVVGDDTVAKSAAFRDLKARHDALVARIVQGEPVEDALAACKAQADTIDPELAGFYSRVPERVADFR